MASLTKITENKRASKRAKMAKSKKKRMQKPGTYKLLSLKDAK